MSSNTTTTMTAAQRVLSIPELVAEIFSWAAENYGLHPSPCLCRLEAAGVTIHRCALVNSLWFHEAMRLVWEMPRKLNAGSFSHITPARRQFYAHFAKVLFIKVYPKHRGWLSRQKKILKDVTFPQARLAYMQILSSVRNFYVPPFHAPALRVLHLHVLEAMDLYYRFYLPVDKCYKLARRIKRLFPSLKKLVFVKPSALERGGLAIFIEQLPGVDISMSAEEENCWSWFFNPSSPFTFDSTPAG